MSNNEKFENLDNAVFEDSTTGENLDKKTNPNTQELELKHQPKSEAVEEKEEIKDQSAEYDSAELHLLALQNSLIGNFDKDGNYKIPNLQRVELINIDKIVQTSNSEEIIAVATIGGKPLNFKISLTTNETFRTATLNLVEDVKVSNTTLYTLSTEIAKYSETDTPNFIYNIRQKFNIHSKDENVGISSWSEYKAPPINLVGELSYKQSELEMIAKAREEIDEKYVIAVLVALKATKAGKGIIREFIREAKKNEYQNMGIGRFLVYRQIIDALTTDAKNKNILTQTQVEEINTSKTKYVTTAAAIISASRMAKEKAEMAGAAPLKTGPAKSAGGGGKKSGGGKSGGGSKGGGSKGGGGGGSKGGKKKKGGKKDDKKKENPLVNIALINALNRGQALNNTPETTTAATSTGEKNTGKGGSIIPPIMAGTATQIVGSSKDDDNKIKKEIDPKALSIEINDILDKTKVKGNEIKQTRYEHKLRIRISVRETHKEL